jgi:hypothetical protein
MWLAQFDPQQILAFERMPIWDYYTILDKKIEIAEKAAKKK